MDLETLSPPTAAPSAPRRISWTTVLASLLLVVVVATWSLGGLVFAQGSDQLPSLLDVVYVLTFLVFPAVGWLIAVKLPRNPLGWIYLSFAVLGLAGTLLEEAALVQSSAGSDAAAAVLIQVGGWVYALSIGLVLGPGVLLFPDGRLPSPRWRYVLWGSVALMLLYGLPQVFSEPTVCVEPVWEGGVITECLKLVDNPLHLAGVDDLISTLGSIVEPLLALAVSLSVVGLLLRYKRSSSDVRQQIKWVIFTAAFGIVPLVILSAPWQLLGFTPSEQLSTLFLIFVTTAVPLAIGVAIFRYRLYDIDRIISRTASYTLIVAILIVVFVASVAVAQRLLPFQGQLGIVVSTLIVAALFNPLRLRVQDAVDRRFNRSRYDAQRVVEEFSARLGDDVDLETMQAALLTTTEDTLEPQSVSLWVREQMQRTPKESSL